MKFDYVIVGAGSAGCVVASRLSQSGRDSVLLLEAGPGDGRFFTRMPLGYGMSYFNPGINWMYWSEPQAELGGRQVYVPRGKMLGGSSSINAMVYIRGQPEDFDDWQVPGWDWQAVRPAFEAVERELKLSSTEAEAHPLCQHFFAAAEQAGLMRNPDFNREGQHGVGHYPVTIHGGERRSASRVFLRPALTRPNLRVETEALVKAIRFEGRRAAGLDFSRGGATLRVEAARAVILCAGAINTPQLLLLSGVGPASELQALGIPVVLDCPAVGRNLQDHVCIDHNYRSLVPSLNGELRPLLGKLTAGLRYLVQRRGPLATSMNHAGGFLPSSAAHQRPNLQLYFCPTTYDRAPPRTRRITEPDPYPGFSLSASSCRPTSRGTVRLKSPRAEMAPAIDLNLLATGHDRQELLEGARFLRQLAAAAPLARVIAEETRPGPDVDLMQDIRARCYSIFHPCGTVAMGEAGALDGHLRFKGLGSLRVIDASVFPSIISGNINAASMMTGWHGAGMVLEE